MRAIIGCSPSLRPAMSGGSVLAVASGFTGCALRAVAGAGQHREARVLREARVGGGKLAEPEFRAALGLDSSRVHAACAEANGGGAMRSHFFNAHRVWAGLIL